MIYDGEFPMVQYNDAPTLSVLLELPLVAELVEPFHTDMETLVSNWTKSPKRCFTRAPVSRSRRRIACLRPLLARARVLVKARLHRRPSFPNQEDS